MPRNRAAEAVRKARKSREDPSVAEEIMWSFLRNGKLGYKFRREHPVGPYRLDFYCAEALLAVEMDGEQHDQSLDAIRDSYLATLGILTYRIPNRQFFGIDNASYRNEIAEIMKLCDQRANRPSPPAPSPPEGRGES